ncbi:MAG: hypothetical protein HY653_02915, partial [Acidobacteria bacterium]|nr:hypothetical protein [Acidobacteriota bacterium]
VFTASDWDILLHEATGKDINVDGTPEVVLEGLSGGAHCCWTYWIVSLGDPPGLVREIENQRDAAFTDIDGDGRIEISTQDGAFDYFDDLSHAETPFPFAILRLEGNTLKDVSPEFWTLYEREISEARAQLPPERLNRFRKVRSTEQMDEVAWDEYREVKGLVLTIVFAYLYGGRAEEAWNVLEGMWPRDDQERIWYLILETRANGVLRYVNSTDTAEENSPKPKNP